MSRYYQGKFKPRNPQKYKGNVDDIVYRSGWELRFMMWCDTNDGVYQWSSEETIVPYISPLDNRPHRYFVDFLIKTKSGIHMIEIKPHKQTLPPKPKTPGEKVKKKYLREVTTYMVNEAKWNAALAYAEKRGWKFRVLTEKILPVLKG